MPHIERPEPPYMQIVRQIRDEIVSGRRAEGTTIPSARRIASEWSVAHATAAKVLSTLRAEGLVKGVAGVGTVVAAQESLYHSARDRSIAVHRTGKIYPPGHYARIRSAALVAAPDRIAGVLGLDDGAQVIRRQRTTYDGDDNPVSTSVSWFDGALAELCPDLLVPDRIRQGTSGYIAECTGRVAVTGYDQVAAGGASPDDAAELGIEPGAAVLLAQNRWADGDSKIIEYGESVSPSGRWAFYDYSINSEAAK